MPESPGPAAIYRARKRIAPHLGRTPLIASPGLSGPAGAAVFLKLETVQPTGSFKVRGAMNRVLTLSAEERARGVVTASSGNHGPGLAWAAARLGVACTVCLSTMVPENKIANVRSQGGEPHIEGKDYDHAVEVAARLTAERGLVYVPAFDDPDIMAGAGTSGIEIVEDLPEVDSVLVPLSGGGLVAGIAIAVKAARPTARVVGVSMERGAAMSESLKAGKPVPVEELPTLADALGGGIGLDNRWTFAAVRDHVDDVVLVDEGSIARAMAALLAADGVMAEGSGAVGAAAILSGRAGPLGESCAVVVSGRNVAADAFLAAAGPHIAEFSG